MEIVQMFLELLNNIGPWVAAVNGLLGAVIVLCMLIPGDQPEKALKAVVDVLAKLSKK